VSLGVLVRPLMPSVPKYLRVMLEGPANGLFYHKLVEGG
jgi:hypothetical protein